MSVDNFQKTGEICDNCRDRWKNIGKPPIAMVALPGYTMRYHSPIAICPYCDGDAIIKIAQKSAQKRETDVAK